jgi:hypothetical protein
LFSLAAQQSSKESFRSVLITARLNQHVDHVAVLIHAAASVFGHSQSRTSDTKVESFHNSETGRSSWNQCFSSLPS